jgi:hypothetical protein
MLRLADCELARDVGRCPLWVMNDKLNNRIERFFNRIKQCRRVATRYDKLAANYLAFVQLASIRLWLRAYESTP